MVPSKVFQQLLGRNLDDPQPNAIRNQHHWRALILCSSARKVTYRAPFDLNILKVTLEKQNTVTLQEQAQWNGDTKVIDYPSEMDPREAFAAAKNRAHGKTFKGTVSYRSNLVVGYGEGGPTSTILLCWEKCVFVYTLDEWHCKKEEKNYKQHLFVHQLRL